MTEAVSTATNEETSSASIPNSGVLAAVTSTWHPMCNTSMASQSLAYLCNAGSTDEATGGTGWVGGRACRGGRDDGGGEAGTGDHAPPQLLCPRPHPRAALEATPQTGLAAPGSELGHALGPGYPARGDTGAHGGARVARSSRLVPLPQSAAPE